jgi:divinyl protochlorophyllide a 8-vinyl-reductase
MGKLIFKAATSEAGVPPVGRIGPNAITQLLEALRQAGLGAAPIFVAADAIDWMANPPAAMVAQERVARVHHAVRSALPPEQAAYVLSEAGRLTGLYLLTNRIPRAAQWVLQHLPARLAAALLARAIRAHAWTFAGTGVFFARAGRTVIFQITGNPLCRGEVALEPICVWHKAVFSCLFAALVSSSVRVVETHCEAQGDPFCRFVVTWGTRA